MKTVVQIIQHLRPGGIETLSLDLLNYGNPNDRTILISLEGTLEEACRHWPRISRFQSRLLFLNKRQGFQPTLIFKIAKLLQRLNADIVHTHHIGPLIYGAIAARLARVKHRIHTEHDAWHLQDEHRRKLQRVALFFARPKLVADAENVAGSMMKYLQRTDVRVIKNGIDTYRFSPGNPITARHKLNLPEQTTLIGCSGRLEKVKGHHILLEAVARLPEDVHLVLAGNGSREIPLRQQAEVLGISERVHFLGQIDEMPTFYQAIDLFCLPSLNEGFPLSPLEAQACGIPAVITDVGGARETLSPDIGKLVGKGDPQQLAIALQEMLEQPNPYNPRTFVESEANVRTMIHNYASLTAPSY